MLFNEFGNKNGKVLLCLHGMCQNWLTEYELLKPLEKDFRLIIPAMDGFYDNCPCDFTTFSDQASQIEEYVIKHHNGHIDGTFGQSQGGLMSVEILSRGIIKIDISIMDGCYIAHQGKIAGLCTYWMFKYYKEHNRPPKIMDIMIKLMGLDPKEAYGMFDLIYWKASLESIKRNLLENYTYHTNPSIANTKTKVYLWCGSKEPYAKKSHNILKKYLKDYEEEIMEGLGHGEFFLKHQDEMCKKIKNCFLAI